MANMAIQYCPPVIPVHAAMVTQRHNGHPWCSYENLLEEWFESVPPVTRSWWPAWLSWLDERSGSPTKPPPMERPVADAAGDYVHMR
jgi:poly(3-hydroxyalkanoate) synthetase